jgi:SlyX protein
MENSHTTDTRLTELEIKASFAEDLIDQLDKIITRQQQQIDLLMREVSALRQAPPNTLSTHSIRDDLPPHF